METAMQAFQRQLNAIPSTKPVEAKPKADDFLIICRLTDVDLETRTATFYAAKDGHNLMTMQVEISALLSKMIKDQRAGKTKTMYENETHESMRYDPLYNHNPLKLVVFNNADGSFKNYRVQHVKEGMRKVDELRDAFGRKITQISYTYTRSVNFNRYEVRTVKA